jgi:predicted metal-dependent hydrolase
MRLRVFPDGRVEVVLPRRAPAGPVEDFVRRSAGWIHNTRARLAARAPESPAISPHETWYRGRRVPVVHRPGAAPPYRVRFTGEAFEITGDGSEERTAPLLEAWFRQAARAVFHARVHALNAETGYAWSRIRVADQTTRWGSCSTKGALSFNWRLLMAPPEVLDYVVIHELAHLREMNHSPRFWALVEARCADYRRHMQWLKDHGATLK